jgi:serine O-acetyltransferase
MNQAQKLWQALQRQASQMAAAEPLLASDYHASILNHSSFESALIHQVSAKLHSDTISDLMLNEVFGDCIKTCPDILDAALLDIIACYERDPACDNYCRPFMVFKGYIAIQAYRFAHCLWQQGRHGLARYISFRCSVLFDVDIHPAATIGAGIMFDHATGIVIGETATIGNDVSMLHGVTLGGTGCESGDRHPKVGNGVMISCGVKVLGNITVGDGVKIGGGSVVLESVPEHVTVVGVPAKIMGKVAEPAPALSMDQSITD